MVYAQPWGRIKCWDEPDRGHHEAHAEGLAVDADVMDLTAQAMLMHPLPVRRNVAATDEVLDGDRSRIYDQAANRAHVQKALLMQLLK